MKRSKLELCESILEALVNKPLTIEGVSYEANIDCITLKKQMMFLIENGLVKERGERNKSRFAVTERGIAVLKALNFQKYLIKIKDKIRAIDEAMEALPNISKHDNSLNRETNN